MYEHSSRVKGFALVVVQRRTAGRATREISARSGPNRSLARTFSTEKFESSGRSSVVMHLRRLLKLHFLSFSGRNRRRRDFTCGGELMQLDRSRSTACIIRFRAFAIGLAFRSPAAYGGQFIFVSNVSKTKQASPLVKIRFSFIIINIKL